MSGTILDGVAVSRPGFEDGEKVFGCTHSYLAAFDGLVRGAGWWTGDVAVLAGLSGMAFHFVVHPTWCASSTNAYDWVTEHAAAGQRLGLSSVAIDHWQPEGFREAQREAVTAIRGSIDRGVAAVIWLPSPRTMGFGLVVGYDDDEGVFFVDDEQGDCDPVRYANLGRTHDLPWLHYQVITGRTPIDITPAAESSLALAVHEWRRGHHAYQSTPFGTVTLYPAGDAGYRALIDGLGNGLLGPGAGERRGLDSILHCWSDGRRLVHRYLAWLSAEGICDGLEAAAGLYEACAGILRDVHDVLASPVGVDQIATAIGLLERARSMESDAVASIELVVRGLAR